MTAPTLDYSSTKYNYDSTNCYKDKIRLFIFICSLLCSFVIIYWYTTRIDEEHDESMKNYTMPWFRIPRKNQKKVGIYQVADSGFGIHFIPYNDEFIPADWSKEEYQYLPCMSKECLCPFFMGKWINESCIVGPGVELKRAHRQEIRTLSDEKFKRWTKMLNELKATGKYTRMARHHKYSGVHSGPAFLLWHREFIKRCEIIFRKHMPIEDVNMGIPYWDSSLDWPLPTPSDSVFFSDIFVGEVDDEGLVKNGPFHNWTSIEGRPQILRQFNKSKDGELLNDARIKWLINNPDFNMIYGASMPIENCSITLPNDPRMFEHSHNYVHFYVNGDMSRGYSASNDIIFYLHHSMIDWILEHWRQNMQTREERESAYPASDPYCFPKWHFADNPMPMLQPFMNKDALSNGYADEIFEYTERPSCSRDNADCGSKYLFCFTPVSFQETPYCVSKVKLGGNCTGFEEYPICHEAKCLKNPDNENWSKCQN